jgi:hypothetical protein
MFIWPKQEQDSEYGHVYIGEWKDNKMHGAGRFHHRDNIVVDSIFCNNLAESDSRHFVNPFLNKQQCSDYINRIARKISDLQKAENLK